MIAGYLGDGGDAGDAFARFARLYADQTEADWASLVAAAKAGKLPMSDDPYMGSVFRPGG
jgi:hypothetical protein